MEMTVRELISALQTLPPEALDMEVEIDLDVEYPTGDTDWIVSPSVSKVVFHQGDGIHTRSYVEMEIVG